MLIIDKTVVSFFQKKKPTQLGKSSICLSKVCGLGSVYRLKEIPLQLVDKVCKSPGIIILKELNFKEHAIKIANKAMRKCVSFSKQLNRRILQFLFVPTKRTFVLFLMCNHNILAARKGIVPQIEGCTGELYSKANNPVAWIQL